ncbi:ABC transporter family substrate-binding protein [Arcanobacterium haemolyticum]|nr:ABC transporter family substrate-binding protein [Arcanobacterium haemolyticum]
MKKTRIIALLAAGTLALSACGGSQGGSDNKGDANSAAVKSTDYLKADYDDLKEGGSLNLSIGELGAQQNVFHQDATSYTTWLWSWYNPQLVLLDDEAKPVANPEYIDSIDEKTVEGNTVVTYKLNDKAVFNDGTPIDVEAFVSTWKANNGDDAAYLPASTAGYERIASIEPGESPKEVVVTFDGAYVWWQGMFNSLLHPSIDTAEEFNSLYENTLQSDLGAGPYKVEQFDQATGVVSFVPNEKWWGKKGKLDRITYKQMESQASLNAFLNKEIDMTSVATAERYTAVKDAAGVKVYTAMRPLNALLMLNASNEFLADSKVRQAVFEGIDREAIFNIAFNGLDYTENLPGSFLLFQTQEGYEDNFSKAVTYDPESAKKALDEAGWVEGADGIREKGGVRLSLRYVLVGDAAIGKNQASAIQQMMKNIGIDLTIDGRPVADFSKIFSAKDFDIFPMSFTSNDPYGVTYFGQFYASTSSLNKSGTGSAEFDEKIKELENIPDRDKQLERANELEVEAFGQYGLMPQYNGPGMAAVREGLANFAGNSGGGSMGFTTMAVEMIGWTK